MKNIEAKLFNTSVKDNNDDNSNTVMQWHKRLGHVNFGDLLRMKNELGIRSTDQKLNCESCDRAKCHRLPFHKHSIKTKGPLELIHADTSGTIRISNIHS